MIESGTSMEPPSDNAWNESGKERCQEKAKKGLYNEFKDSLEGECCTRSAGHTGAHCFYDHAWGWVYSTNSDSVKAEPPDYEP